MIIMQIRYKVSTLVFIVATALVFAGYCLQKWALENGSQIWINLSPDIMGAGVLIFALGVITYLVGKTNKIKGLR